MSYDPEIHHRRTIRLKGYDYSKAGAYFVTVCSYNKESLFSTVGAGLASARKNSFEIELKPPGQIIFNNWFVIPNQFDNVIADDLVIMPNHVHGILFIKKPDWADARPASTLGDIVCSFKSRCVTDYIKYLKDENAIISGKIWQRSYYEHIIRDERELKMYRNYIQDNPGKWHEDEYFV